MKTPAHPWLAARLPLARCRPSGAQRGVTLVEWMIAITIGLVLVAGLSLLFSQQSSTQAELEKSSRQIENGRYAMQMLRDDIQLAGYYGEFGADVTASSAAAPSVAPLPCANDLAGPGNFPLVAIEGFDAPNAVLPCGIQAANHIDGTDILLVRHADAASNPNGVAIGDIKAGQLYIQTGIKNGVLRYAIAAASADGVKPPAFDLLRKDGVTPGTIRKYLVHVYFLSPCSVMKNGATCTSSDDGGTPIPTLRLLEPSSGSTASTPLVEGIENMQFDYGIDATGDGAPDSYAASPADWANVVALRVNLLARSNERSPGYSDQKSYTLGLAGATTPTGDAFKRHVFSQMVRVVNVSARRDR